MYLCICKAVSDVQIRQLVEQGARTIGDVSARFGVGAECGKCVDDIRAFLDVCLAFPPPVAVEGVLPPAAVEVVPPPATVDATPQRAAWFAVDL